MFFAPLLVTAPLAAAPLPQENVAPVTDILLVYCAGADALFVDPKDQAFLSALRLIDDRIAELPNEIPDFPRELAAVWPFLSRLSDGAMTMRVGAWNDADPRMGPPLFMQLTLPEQSPTDAAAFTSKLTRFLETAGMPRLEPDEMGRYQLPLPLPVWYGAEGNRFRFTVGMADEGEVVPGATGLPEGVDAAFAMSLEYGAMMEQVANLAAMSGDPSVAQMQEMFGSFMDDMSIQMAYGTDESWGYTTLSMPGYGRTMIELGVAPTRTLGAADFSRVPADSTWATMGTVNFGGIVDMYMEMMEPLFLQAGMTGDPLEMVEQQLGFALREDFIDHLGSVWGMFSSDTTGGGGTMSTVAFCEVKDAEGLRGTMAQLSGMANAIAGQAAMGYARIDDWEQAGVTYTTVVFPGLPVPMELTWAIHGGYLYAGLTPQAVMSAVVHAQQGGAGLLGNQRFVEGLAGGPEDLMNVSFIDTAELIRSGYGMMTLLGSALRNGTRSPSDPRRDAGMVLPAYPVLAAGARATVTVTRLDGEDLVSETRGDRSMVVGLTAMLGALGSSPLPVLVVLGAVGAAGQQQSMASMYAEEDFMFEELEHEHEGGR